MLQNEKVAYLTQVFIFKSHQSQCLSKSKYRGKFKVGDVTWGYVNDNFDQSKYVQLKVSEELIGLRNNLTLLIYRKVKLC